MLAVAALLGCRGEPLPRPPASLESVPEGQVRSAACTFSPSDGGAPVLVTRAGDPGQRAFVQWGGEMLTLVPSSLVEGEPPRLDGTRETVEYAVENYPDWDVVLQLVPEADGYDGAVELRRYPSPAPDAVPEIMAAREVVGGCTE